MQNQFIKSALNYTGGKYKLLSQIIPQLPFDYERLVDLFSGGATVAINVANLNLGKRILINDIENHVIELFQHLAEVNIDDFINQVENKITYYELSNTKVNGYKFYNLDSTKGLGSYNKEKYERLRDDYNKNKNDVLFYLLIVYGFNNQVRFNKQKNFNLPVGKRDFNANMEKKLRTFHQSLKSHPFDFSSEDFRNVEITNTDLIYVDPPYRIATATYNENGGWKLQDDLDLMRFLDEANEMGAKFALSNVIIHNGKKNEELIKWSEKYKLHKLDFHYNNSNYQNRVKDNKTQEVLITNY